MPESASTDRPRHGEESRREIPLAREVSAEGITVNAVAPGTTATERFRVLRSPEETRRLAESVPLRRIAEPAEIAESVLFLASDAARYITGATLDVNGGLLMI